MSQLISKRKALQFILLIGLVSLFADMTYEGARSITGQYLAVLGASGTAVGIIAGLGELIGYGFRLVSGYFSDKTGKYWSITLFGYATNLLAVPFLALAGNWQFAAALIILERFGKAIRTPPKDAMLSYATKLTGRGWGFGLQEAMDKTGAILGPLFMSGVLFWRNSYREGFAVLLIPAICALAVLFFTRKQFPRPQDLEVENPDLKPQGFSRKYWLYLAGIGFVGAGYVDFALIAYHFAKNAHMPDIWVPMFYAVAMGASGLSALIFGALYDHKGLSILILAILISAWFAPLVFMSSFYWAFAGVILWGVGIGAQESIMRAVVADMISMDKRATAYGMMNIWFGVFWFAGSAFMGFLYDISLVYLVIFSLVAQLASIPILLVLRKS